MKLIAELQRRNVFRVAIFYVVSAWLLLQIADLIFEVLLVPDWTLRFIFGALVAAFPFALFLAWAYELTPEGIKREVEVDRSRSVTPQTGRRIDRLIIVVLGIAVAALLVDRWTGTEAGSETGSVSVSEGEADTDAVSATAATADARSIAVLPFRDFSGGEDQAWFAQGLSEEILNALARAPDLLVAARTSSFRYADSDLPVTAIAAELDVAHVLEGSVRRTPDRIRVTAQLIRAADGFHLWSENYDRSPDDVIAIQEDIARSIAEALETAMDPAALAAMMDAGTRSVAAYNAFLRARSLLLESVDRGDFDMQAVVASIEEARRLDPGFARAHAEAARLYEGLAKSTDMRTVEGRTQEELWQSYEAAIARAIETTRSAADRARYEAIEAMASLALARAEERYRTYLAERPNDLDSVNELAEVLLTRGDRAAARALLEPYADRASAAGNGHLVATNLVYAGAPGPGIEILRRILERSPGSATPIYQLHRALLWNERPEEAAVAYRELRTTGMGTAWLLISAMRDACSRGNRPAAETLFDQLRPANPGLLWHALMILGEPARAAEALLPLDATAHGRSDLLGFLDYPQFDPRPFPRLMARIEGDLVAPRPHVDRLPFACPPREAPSVAVLPFVNMSGDAENQYFSDGIAEELLNALVEIEGLRVPSRTSSFRFRDSQLAIGDIAEQLGVAHVLEGSVRKAGDQVRITAQLIEARTDRHLWSETWTRTLDDIFAIQDEIATAIVEELALQLAPDERPSIAGTRDSEAYDRYLRGRYLWHQRNADTLAAAGRELREAVRLDPDFADAWAALADVYTLQPEYGVADVASSIPAARSALERAIALEPESAMALTTRAYLDFRYLREFRSAEADFEAALRSDPGYATAHQWYAEMLMALGRLDEALSHAERAFELDPVGPIKPVVVGNVLRFLGRSEEAVDYYRKALELNSDSPFALANLARALAALGRFDEAREASLRLEEVNGIEGSHAFARVALDALEGKLPVDQAVARIREHQGAGRCRFGGVPGFLMQLGAREALLEVLQQCADEDSPFGVTIGAAPELLPLHDDPRFRRIVEQILGAETAAEVLRRTPER